MQEKLLLELMARHMVEVKSSRVEVYGQYLVAEADEPSMESHVRIACFSTDGRIIRRTSGASRDSTILGDDGKKYDFFLETSVHAVFQ